MREIKFKVWDVLNQRMIYKPYLFERKPEYLDNPEPYIFYETFRDVEDGIGRLCHIMQFTGLHDKNGKEIYEGDILLNPLATAPEDKGWIVIWKDYGFYYSLIDIEDIVENKDFRPFGDTDIYFEIIGNIYENPELLNQTK